MSGRVGEDADAYECVDVKFLFSIIPSFDLVVSTST